MKRKSHIQPGFDCREECTVHKPPCGGQYGVACDYWWYVVANDQGDVALSLCVSSGVYPGGAYREPSGTDIALHTAWPTDRGVIRDGTKGTECEYIEAGRCYSPYCSGLDADKLFTEYGIGRFEQMESFWKALEDKLRALEAEYRPQRADEKYQRCNHCDGIGTVAR